MADATNAAFPFGNAALSPQSTIGNGAVGFAAQAASFVAGHLSADRRLRLFGQKFEKHMIRYPAHVVAEHALWGRPDIAMIEFLFIYNLARNPLQAIARRWYCRSLHLASRGRRRCPECRGS